MKSPFKSKTLAGVFTTLVGSTLAAAPGILHTAAVADPRVALLVSVGGAVLATYGRYKATDPLS